MKAQIHSSRSGGFALVVTLSLMILLTVIAVGLLTLSSISLRASSQGEAMATARANARLALMLAIGDLQKNLGPDRAVTATSEILAAGPATPVAKPNTTGVWESWWDFNPNSSPAPAYTTQKTNRFRRWLVSSADPAAPVSRDFVTTAWTGKTVELVGNVSLGGSSTSPAAPAAKAIAGLVPVSKDGKVQGSYAWHVSDESVKARINLYRDPSQNTTLAQKRALLAGHRPDPSVMKGPDGTSPTYLPTDLVAAEFVKAKEKSGKIIDLDQVELLDLAKGKSKQFRNDVTPYSMGLLTDVRRGGLKQDLSSVFEMSTASGAMSLPTAFSSATTQKLYQSTTPTHTGVSDPYWSTLWGYYNSFRNINTPNTTPTLILPASANSLTADLTPKTYFPGPAIAKVDMIFSFVVHPVSDVFWFDRKGKQNGVLDDYDYFVDLIYTPVVTLHNPYNVSISFHKMSVEFKNVPVAFNFMFQAAGAGPFVSQSVTPTPPNDFESINDMTGKSDRGEKTFSMTIANWSDTTPLTATSAISGPIVMKPGQTVICGLSKDPAASFGRGDMFDYQLSAKKTENNKAVPKYNPGLGFELDGVTISNMREHIFGNPSPGAPGGWGPDWCTFLLLRNSVAKGGIDKFYVKFKAQRPRWHTDWDSNNGSVATQEVATPSFEVTAKLQTSSSGTPINYAKIDLKYNTDASLKSFFNDREYRYPPTDSYSGAEIASPPNVTYATQFSFQHPFAIFSASARTTNGGVYETGSRSKAGADTSQINLLKDGRLAGKPFLFHNPSRAVVTMDLATGKPGAQPFELNLQPFTYKDDLTDNYISVDNINRVPAITGNTTARGIKSASYLEIPTGPMQTIADFRRSNALTSSYLPHFVQPVGNSLLHPLMSPNRVMESNAAISATALLDHSVLANHAFYDRFYFSTFATRGTTVRPDTVFEQFMNGTAPLASQAFQPYLPAGKTIATAKAELYTSNKPNNTAYQKAAEYQMVQGQFNVNSTSVQAWKAVLASMNKSDVATLWAKNATLETNTSPGVPILAMSLLNGGITGGTVDAAEIDNVKTNDWNGYRELSDAQLTTLATEIVEEVRLRGPFLSMSEFVNRQVGAQSALTLSGALEKAISDSGINGSFMSTHVTPLATGDFSNAALYNYKTPAATIGNPAAGAPGWISQGDLMRILEPAATVRSDTFVIRGCGEAQDASGKITARAFAEAVVQRVPEYVDPVDRPSVNAYDITLPTAVPSTAAAANKAFGRRMNVVSFRWLSSNEI